MTSVRLVRTSIEGLPMGQDHYKARHSDALVQMARDLRAAGATFQAIADRVGAHPWTVQAWVNGRRRRPPDRVVARRVKDRPEGTSADQSGRSGTLKRMINPQAFPVAKHGLDDGEVVDEGAEQGDHHE